jgi:hypothetical protein
VEDEDAAAAAPARPPRQPVPPPAPPRPAPGGDVRFPDFIARRTPPPSPAIAPSQQARPNPIAPGSSTTRPPVPVETMAGPFRREPPAASPPEPRLPPPPGMTDADVNVLYAKYVKARGMVGRPASPGSFGKLMRTIHAQAPRIMEQYHAKGVDFSVVIKDNQVIIRAKPKL